MQTVLAISTMRTHRSRCSFSKTDWSIKYSRINSYNIRHPFCPASNFALSTNYEYYIAILGSHTCPPHTVARNVKSRHVSPKILNVSLKMPYCDAPDVEIKSAQTVQHHLHLHQGSDNSNSMRNCRDKRFDSAYLPNVHLAFICSDKSSW